MNAWKMTLFLCLSIQEKITSLNEENVSLKEKQETMEEQLADETRRADGMQDLMESKSLEIMRLKDEVEKLQNDIKSLEEPRNNQQQQQSVGNTETMNNGDYLPPLKPFKLPLEYFIAHLTDYENNKDVLQGIWNKIDIDGNNQTLVNAQSLDLILKAFMFLIKITYITEKIDHRGRYDMEAKQQTDILNEAEILNYAKIDYQRGVFNRPFIKDKQTMLKKQFMTQFIHCITDVQYENKIDELQYANNAYNDDEDDDKEDEFDQLEFISTSPTVIGVSKNKFDAQEYATRVNEAIAKQTDNDKERIRNAMDVLIKCNGKQRQEISVLCGDLNESFENYSRNKNVLKLLALMMKPLSRCDAEWIYKAIEKKQEDVLIEILFTRTNKQIKALLDAYNSIYQSDLFDDIEDAFSRKDEEFVIMCQTLLELKKRTEVPLTDVNKKWANNDAKRIKDFLMDDSSHLNDDKVWDTITDLVVNRSWSHIDVVNNAFEAQTRVSLPYQLRQTGANRSIARKAAMVVLQAASTMHQYFAEKLKQSMKGSFGVDDDTLHRILLSRSQIDLGDIDQEFTNNSEYGEGKTTRQWIEEHINSSLYQYIILNLLGLTDIQLRDRILSNNSTQPKTSIHVTGADDDKEDDEEDEIPEMYRDGLVKYNPSIKQKPLFNAAKDVNQIGAWIKDFDTKLKGDKGSLKERLANILSSRNAQQRGLIKTKYPNIMEDITKKLKKGHVVHLCDGLLKPSIAAYNASIIEDGVLNTDLNKIGDILCTSNNAEIKEIIEQYRRLYYNSDLVKKIADLCEKNKRGSVSIILESLLKCKRNERDLSIDVKKVQSDVDFLIGTKKFKSEEKKRFVEIFCNRNWKYIREINRQYGMRSKSVNLEKLIEKQLGSGSGYFTSVLLKYSLDPTEYFAQRLFELGGKFDKNRDEIARIFVSRSEIDLNDIRARFAKKQYGKQLDKWIEEKSKKSKFGFFLTQILTSIDRYNSMMVKKQKFRKESNYSTSGQSNEPSRRSTATYEPSLRSTATYEPPLNTTASLTAPVIVDHVDNDNDNENKTPASAPELSPSPISRSTSSKPKYDNLDLQEEIVNDDTKREQSLAIFTSENGGLITFLEKYLKSKIVEKMWIKLDSKQRGYIEITSFPDLIAFVVILYKVKVHQQKTKSKTKPAMDNKQVRAEIEHIAIWMAKTYVYQDNIFKLTQDDFQNKFASWAQEYVDVDGVLMDF